ncbi:uncharacterized protein LOC106457189 [Limulus polyphemus]|uniref:Uncharacterized protein LOC106457189 n=1 Tax=Limulus polyphemus TaxID=6850 RepID=A0ABM1B040_LIMPO|nr:uncharacterized protein LOC106457189 [Limulus polyphemus]XP_022238730.1 uncharacterized protein LOC106457189 [Limulus polyphemus]XP_022238731.1 uncharacterized protein LOC106457189 [Limulus polyphemus]XP_022238732.1 uncharacterized protein LOC106457189 [Limulus polyphemus]XP_022238733.1 uncharacterized protein LOC106457189 [Limulus polyphemus]XP_022238734.1 uncharacterized protein LOC106457189 [Limulus polyphemus]
MQDTTLESDAGSPHIKTLIFMDLEATGIPTETPKKNVQITEIALVAISRDHFDSPSDKYRILNKLSLCVQPKTCVTPSAVAISGLCNVYLSTECYFEKGPAQQVKSFLEFLPQPICLVAHNGHNFDFPLLKAELRKAGVSLPEFIFCVDTLTAFKSDIHMKSSWNSSVKPETNTDSMSINNQNPCSSYQTSLEALTLSPVGFSNKSILSKLGQTEKTVSLTRPNSMQNFHDNNVENLLNEETEVLLTAIEQESVFFPEIKAHKSNGLSDDTHYILCPGIEGTSQRIHRDFLTPKKMNTSQKNYSNVQKGVKRKRTLIHKEKHAVPARKRLYSNDNINFVSTKMSQVISNVYGKHDIQVSNKISKMQLSLSKLHEYFFGAVPSVSHAAEADCHTLMKICHKLQKNFLCWMDKNAVCFEKVSPMW